MEEDSSDAYGSDEFEDIDEDEGESVIDKAVIDKVVEPDEPESSLPSPATSKQSSQLEAQVKNISIKIALFHIHACSIVIIMHGPSGCTRLR